MDDPDVIAYLFPPEGQGRDGALVAINMPANRSRFRPPRQPYDLIDPVPEPESGFVREETEKPEEVDDLERLPCLVLRFSDRPKNRQGLVAGRSPRVDLMMPQYKGVSGSHFALTFDEQKELVIKDLRSSYGTGVIYDGKEMQQGRGITWSARGPDLVKSKGPILKVVGELQFRLVVPDHDTTSPIYLDNVARFLEGTAAAEDLLPNLEISNCTQTELPTPGEFHTPFAQEPGRIFWRKELGRGTFGVVTYIWEVTSRAVYALKEPRPGRGGDWKREAEAMRGISHDNIVALKHASFDAGPQLYFEYVPGGALSHNRYKFTTPFQRGEIATQLLDGIKYLHEERSLVHRDIKPENVLVQYWSPDRVHVKLGDFGLSRQSEDLKTFCGTQSYLAPEILCVRLNNCNKRKAEAKYDALVDIWSLAVLLVKLECGKLPKYRDHYAINGKAWGNAMVDFVQKSKTRHETNNLRTFILDDMLVVDPEKRQPAKICHVKALQLFRGGTNNTPRPLLREDVISVVNDSGASEASTIRLCAREGEYNSQISELSGSKALAPGSKRLYFDPGEKGSDFAKVTSEARVLVADLKERDESAQLGIKTDPAGSGFCTTIVANLATAAREDAGPSAKAGDSLSRQKRPKPEGERDLKTGRFSSKFAEQEPKKGDSKHKRYGLLAIKLGGKTNTHMKSGSACG